MTEIMILSTSVLSTMRNIKSSISLRSYAEDCYYQNVSAEDTRLTKRSVAYIYLIFSLYLHH